MSTDPIDTETLRSLAEDVLTHEPGLVEITVPGQSVTMTAEELVALLDRIESLEAEAKAAVFAEKSMDRMHDIAEARADRAEARLTRVTDDSMRDRLAAAIADQQACGHCSGECAACQEEAAAVLATIRVVAADEQED